METDDAVQGVPAQVEDAIPDACMKCYFIDSCLRKISGRFDQLSLKFRIVLSGFDSIRKRI